MGALNEISIPKLNGVHHSSMKDLMRMGKNITIKQTNKYINKHTNNQTEKVKAEQPLSSPREQSNYTHKINIKVKF